MDAVNNKTIMVRYKSQLDLTDSAKIDHFMKSLLDKNDTNYKPIKFLQIASLLADNFSIGFDVAYKYNTFGAFSVIGRLAISNRYGIATI